MSAPSEPYREAAKLAPQDEYFVEKEGGEIGPYTLGALRTSLEKGLLTLLRDICSPIESHPSVEPWQRN
jgi:hypothetical protein